MHFYNSIKELKSYPILTRGASNEAVITVTRGAFNFSQSKPSKVKYKCYNTAWLGICLARPQASCIYIRQTPRGCVITYIYMYMYICIYIYVLVLF